MMATVPLTDKRRSDFLEGAQFAVCPVIAPAMDFLFSYLLIFPSVACFRYRMPFKRMAGRGKVFGLNTLHRRKILPETALPPDLAATISAMRYLCIRASGTGD